jgi:hypothetical protein
LVEFFTDKTAPIYIARKLPFFTAFLSATDNNTDVVDLLRFVAPEFAHQISFILADSAVYAEQMLRLGVDPLHRPVLVFDHYAATPSPHAFLYFSPQPPSPLLQHARDATRLTDAVGLRAFLQSALLGPRISVCLHSLIPHHRNLQIQRGAVPGAF